MIRRRTPLRRTARLEQAKPLRASRRRPAPPRDVTELFKETVCAEPCIGSAIPGHVCEPPLQAMHVVPKQTLRRRGLGHLVWDPVNGVAGCYRLHRRHDGAVDRVPRSLLPSRCIEWAVAHGVLDALERHWPEGSS